MYITEVVEQLRMQSLRHRQRSEYNVTWQGDDWLLIFRPIVDGFLIQLGQYCFVLEINFRTRIAHLVGLMYNVKKPTKCQHYTISGYGTRLLQFVDTICHAFSMEYCYIADTSTIKQGEKTLSLAVQYMARHGHTWYNSHGYLYCTELKPSIKDLNYQHSIWIRRLNQILNLTGEEIVQLIKSEPLPRNMKRKQLRQELREMSVPPSIGDILGTDNRIRKYRMLLQQGRKVLGEDVRGLPRYLLAEDGTLRKYTDRSQLQDEMYYELMTEPWTESTRIQDVLMGYPLSRLWVLDADQDNDIIFSPQDREQYDDIQDAILHAVMYRDIKQELDSIQMIKKKDLLTENVLSGVKIPLGRYLRSSTENRMEVVDYVVNAMFLHDPLDDAKFTYFVKYMKDDYVFEIDEQRYVRRK